MATERCEVQGCENPVSKDGVCLRHKLLTVSVGTVPGGAKDERTGISTGKKMEYNLNRYRRRKQAGDKPSGITDYYYKRDRDLERAHDRGLMEEDPR